MTPITLSDIKAEQTRLAQLIQAFEAQASTQIHFPEQLIDLAAGEEYAGIITGQDGDLPYHLILLPGEAEDITWPDARAWACQAGGGLPSRREQSLLFANLKDQFQARWYWSNEQHAANAYYAWSQTFTNGSQDYDDEGAQRRARAVRRLTIE